MHRADEGQRLAVTGLCTVHRAEEGLCTVHRAAEGQRLTGLCTVHRADEGLCTVHRAKEGQRLTVTGLCTVHRADEGQRLTVTGLCRTTARFLIRCGSVSLSSSINASRWWTYFTWYVDTLTCLQNESQSLLGTSVSLCAI